MKLSDTVTVTIIMATYNGEAYIQDQLESIKEQTLKSWTLLVSDDGSTDHTISLVKEFSGSIGQESIIIKNQGQKGACGNFFYGLQQALELTDSNYFAFSDQDDYWMPSKTADSLALMKEIEDGDPNMPVLIFTDAEVVDKDLNTIGNSFFKYTGVNPNRTNLNSLLVQNPVSGAGILINRALATRALKMKSLDHINMHDQWIALVASCFGKIECLKKTSYKYRQHDANTMGAIEMSIDAILDKIKIAKSSIVAKKKQAIHFLTVYKNDLSRHDYDLIEGFINLGEKSKFIRMKFCLDNDLKMNGFLRNIGLLFFI